MHKGGGGVCSIGKRRARGEQVRDFSKALLEEYRQFMSSIGEDTPVLELD